MKFKSVLTHAAAVTMTAICASSAFAEETLRLSYFGGPQGTTYAKAIVPWVEKINSEGEGILKIDAFPGGALVGNPRGQVTALTDGVADIAFVVFSYTPGRFPDNSVLELPTLYEDVHESSGVIRALYNAGMLRGFDDFYVPMIVTTFPYNFHTKDPVNSLEDLKGMKIRAGGPVAGAALEALGAAPVGMPAPAIAENISKGVIDGAAVDWSVLYGFRVDAVAKNHYMQLFSTVPIGIMMTKERFNSLSPEAQALIEKYSEEWLEDVYTEATAAAQDTFIAKNKATDGHTIVTPSAEDKAAYEALMNGVVEEWVAAEEGRADMLAFVRAELERIRAAN